MFDFLVRNRFEIYEVCSAKRHDQVVFGLKLKRIAFPDSLKQFHLTLKESMEKNIPSRTVTDTLSLGMTLA